MPMMSLRYSSSGGSIQKANPKNKDFQKTIQNWKTDPAGG